MHAPAPLTVLDGVDAFQCRFKRRETLLLDGLLVHIGRVVVTDPALVRAGRRFLRGFADQVCRAFRGQLRDTVAPQSP